jgi:hypothetical protein
VAQSRAATWRYLISCWLSTYGGKKKRGPGPSPDPRPYVTPETQGLIQTTRGNFGIGLKQSGTGICNSPRFHTRRRITRHITTRQRTGALPHKYAGFVKTVRPRAYDSPYDQDRCGIGGPEPCARPHGRPCDQPKGRAPRDRGLRPIYIAKVGL